ncbi:hypothetical protein JW962_01375 [Candidatus Dojkabacteria bacterium]|nr:hypothetical protein [Candidatus Dojkabacteria bacterium]
MKKLKATKYLLILLIMAVCAGVIYFTQRKPIELVLLKNLLELARADTAAMLPKNYSFFISSSTFIFLLPVFPIGFTFIYNRRESLLKVLIDSVICIVLWTLICEGLIRLLPEVLLIRPTMEGYNISETIFFPRSYLYTITTFLCMVSVIGSLIISLIPKKKASKT